jgi:hypothetical protein
VQKLSHEDYLTQQAGWQEIRDELTAICNRVESLKTDHRIDFPAVTHFVTKDRTLKGRAIFQSNYSLVNQRVYLKDPSDRPFSFDLTTGGGNSAFMLLDVVSRAVKDIIRLFKRLEANHDDIYPELLRQCFGGTDYLREIQAVKQIGWRHEWCETNYGYLLTNGFGLFEIRTDQSRLTDPDEVAIRYLSMSKSPEALMREMCRMHLVFGLSATAHISRSLRNFDWVGLAHPLLPATSFHPLPITDSDEADIDRANREKAAIRQNTIRFEVAEPLPQTTALGQQLAAIADRSGEVFDTGERRNQRLKRTCHFFGLLAWLSQQQQQDTQPTDVAQTKTHLVFLASLRQLRYLFQTIRQDEDGWFRATPQTLPASLAELELYEVQYHDENSGNRLSCYVVLYDARFGQALRKDPALEEQYNALFWDEKPVIVVTTYPSAGNGVNLQYYLTRTDYEQRRTAGKRDFNHLHLLDSPYFYFGNEDPNASTAEKMAVNKRNVYNLMKLLHAKHISEAQAIGQLGQLTRLKTFNATYLALPDGVLNQFSVFVQALGRIERVWQPTANQTIRLDRDVYQVFERVVSDADLQPAKHNYLRFASATMQTLLEAIETHGQHHRNAIEDELLDISRANQQARQAIHELVLDIQQFRRVGKPTDIRKRWQQLREDVLKHNVQADSLREIGGVFQTNYGQEGQLFINRQGQIAPPTVYSHEFTAWQPNGVYHPLTRIPNTAITNYFRVRGYELAFLHTSQPGNSARSYFFLPYVYQAILMGAVGEEATLAILRMKGVQATADTIPNALFEVADLRVSDPNGQPRPIFIDCKNYGLNTLTHFGLPPDDPLYNPALNEPLFKDKMTRKWQELHAVVGAESPEPCRLVVVNLVHDEEGALRYYDTHFDPVNTWETARIIVLTGALKPAPTDPKDLLTAACNRLVAHLLQS